MHVLDDGWDWLRRHRDSSGGSDAIDNLLQTLLENAEVQLAAATVLLAGTTVTIILAGGAGEFTMVMEGVAAADTALMTNIADPLMQELGRNLGQIQTLTAGSAPAALPAALPGVVQPSMALAAMERAYRGLARRAAATLTRGELELLHGLRTSVAPTEALVPESAIHKAWRWADYQARPGTDNWTFERWSKGYEVGVRQARRANAIADAYRDSIGWGQREVRVTINGKVRVLDIADMVRKRAVEVKSGYVTHGRRVARQLLLDTALVEQKKWTVTWYANPRLR